MFSRNALWTEYIRFCLNCATLNKRVECLCPSCYLKLKKWMQPNQFIRTNHYFTHLYLFYWGKDSHRHLSPLIYGLKGGGLAGMFKLLAWELSLIAMSKNLLKKDCYKDSIFVPAPSKKINQQDHAYELAKALSEIWQTPLWLGLKRQKKGEQKRRSKKDREQLKLVFKEGISRDEVEQMKSKRIIFVDDILTTGSTARSTWQLLGKPNDFKVLTLFYRGYNRGPLAVNNLLNE